jgi:YD repeat-containing protein
MNLRQNDDAHLPTARKRKLLFAALLLLLSASRLVAQDLTSTTPLGVAPGSPAGSYALSGFENVNLFNGNLNFNLSLVQVGGRGGAQVPLLLPIEQRWVVKHWLINVATGEYVTYADPNWWNDLIVVPRYGIGSLYIRYSGQGATTGCPSGDQDVYFTDTMTRMTFVAPDGTEYDLRDQLSGGQALHVSPNCPGTSPGASRGKVFVTADGTAATFVSDATIHDSNNANSFSSQFVSGYLMTRDGTRYRIDNGDITWMRDRNGNKLAFVYDNGVTTITDSLNRRVTIEYAVTDAAPYGLCDRITLKGFGGADRKIRISKKNLGQVLRSGYTLQTGATLFPELNGSDVTSYDTEKVSAVWLPDGRSYDFFYNSYGELARVELPMGGAFEYDWACGLSNGSNSGVMPGGEAIYRRVVERRIYHEGNVLENRQTFSRPESTLSYYPYWQNLGYVAFDQYDAAGTLLTRAYHYFHGDVSGSMLAPGWYPGVDQGREYQTEAFDTNGTTVLRRTQHTWQGNGTMGGMPVNPRIVETDTTIEPYGANLVSKVTFAHDQYNNQTDAYEYDYGSGVPGSLVRHTHTDYLTTNSVNGSAYDSVNPNTTYPDPAATIHLRSLPKQISVFDAGGTERARTTYEYDNYATDTNHATIQTYPRPGHNELVISGLDTGFNSGSSNLTRGNTTTATHYLLNTSGSVTGSLAAYAQYDIAGNVVKAIDARGYATTFDFADCFGAPDGDAQANTAPSELSSQSQYSYAFATAVTNALGQTAYLQLDYYLGRPVDAKDANGTTYSGYCNDVLDRPTQIVRAVNNSTIKSQSTFAYNDSARTVTVTSDQANYGDNLLKGQTIYDGLGRTIETRAYENSTQYIAVQHVPFGTLQDPDTSAWVRAAQSSNPFRPLSETPVWTTSFSDALGRTTKVRTPDNAIARTSYSGNSVTVSDQISKARKSVSDALGRLTQVYEDPSSANWLTSYQYDALNDLTSVSQYDSVSQHTQTRTFVYDSLKRLTSATNPESGTVCYGTLSGGQCQAKWLRCQRQSPLQDRRAQHHHHDSLRRVESPHLEEL